MTPLVFLAFLSAMVAFVVALCGWFIGRRAAAGIMTAIFAWFIYVSAMSVFGIAGNAASRPPGFVVVVIPVAVFLIVFTVRSLATARLALAFPLWILLATQCFRVGVELILHRLWVEGIVPRTLTFSGSNVDIYVGASAPLIAWAAMRGRGGLKLALVWNILGVLALANVVSRSVMTTPGPLNLIHAEVPNRMMGMFPYVFIPGFFVPLAVVLHVLAIRAILSRVSDSATAQGPTPQPRPH